MTTILQDVPQNTEDLIIEHVADWLYDYALIIIKNRSKFTNTTYKEDAESLLKTIAMTDPTYFNAFKEGEQ